MQPELEFYEWYDKTANEYVDRLRPLALAGMGREPSYEEERALREWVERQGDEDRDDLLVILENHIPIQVFTGSRQRCLVVPAPKYLHNTV